MAAARKTMTKRSAGARKKRSTGKRETLTTPSATLYAKRSGRGRFKEMDEKGRSLNADRRTKAKTTAKPGYVGRGDRAV